MAIRRSYEEHHLSWENARKKIVHLGEEWQAWQDKRFDESATICPTCGQLLPQDQIQAAREKFNLTRSEEISRIEQEGNETREHRRKVSESMKEEQQKITDYEKELEDLKSQLDKLAAAIVTPPPFEETEDFRKLSSEIESLQKEEAVLKAGADKKLPPLREKDAECVRQLEELSRRKMHAELNQQQDQRIQELISRQKELNLELTNLDDGLTLAEQFIRLRAMDLEESINSHFEVVRWKLFDIQVNGGVKACCEATADNDNGVYVEYSSNLNDGRRIQAGVDIANAVAKATGITAPIWIDGAGELTRELHTDLQCIRLYASEADKQLRVEV